MATREEIYAAIRNADKAGDAESVRKLGAYLQTMDAPAEVAQAAPAAPAQQTAPRPNFGAQMLSAAVRQPLQAAAGIPMMAADAGVGLVNFLRERRMPTLQDFNPFAMTRGDEGGGMALPSAQWNEALDSVTLKPEGLVGKGSEIVSSAVLGSKLPGLPTAPAKPPPKMTGTQEAFVRGRQAGYVAPPSSVAATKGRQFVESVGGKAATQQVASIKNQRVTNQLIARDLGLPEGQAITREALAKVRATAGKVYGEIQGTGVVTADPEYVDELRSILKPAEELADDFPDLNLGNNEAVTALVKSLSRDKFSAKGAVEATKQLRKAASGNLGGANAADPAKRAMGYAQRNAADAIEALVGRHLRALGRGDLAEQFDAARTTIAKAHAAESALNPATGNIAARELARNFRKGKPMSDGFRQAAEFASAFPKATAEILDSGPVSALDAAVAGAGSSVAAGLGGLSFAPLGLAWPALRMGSRYGMLTPGFQNALIPVNGSTQPLNALYGLTAGANSLVGQ